MGRRGPKSAPTHLKVLRGVREDRINQDEPKPPPGAPECPALLEGEAREAWDRVTPKLLAMGLLTPIDGEALTLYCVAYARWAKAVRRLEELGSLVTDTARGGDRVSSYVRIAENAAAECKRLLDAFGGTPSARSSLKVQTEARDELADFLAQRRGS